MWVPQLAVALLLLAGAVAVAPAETASLPTPEHRAMRVGDAAAYDMFLSGDWVYAGLAGQFPMAGPRFEVRAPDLVTTRDGSRVHAFPVATESPATTLLPSEAGPTWTTFVGTQWLDGLRVATQTRGAGSAAFGVESVSHEDAIWTYPDGALGDCLLSPPRGHACDLPAFHIRLDAAPVQDLGVEKVAGAALHHLRATDGTTQVDWWFAQDIPFPVRFAATTAEADGPRVLRLKLTAFQEGTGASDLLRSSFAPSPLEWAPRMPWGPDDQRAKATFPLSDAYQAAWSDPSFPLRQWLARHAGYVFMAEPSHDATAWTVHLSDGTAGFSFRARLVAPLLPLDAPRVELQQLEPSPLAPAAPRLDDAPGELPTVASMWARWTDHAQGSLRRDGANVWAFRILEGPDGSVVHLAAGRAQEIQWGHDVSVAGIRLGGSQRESAILVTDGQGQAMSYRQTDRGGHVAPASGPAFTPRSLPDMPAWPWTATQTGAGAAAIATVSLLLPKAALALFTRFRPGELLEHPMRAMVMDAVRAEPGVHFRALCTRLGANPGRVRHHVRKLVEGGHLVQRQSPGYTCYFPQDSTPRSLLQAGPLMRSDGARNLIGCLATRPGTNAKELACLAGLSPATATYHLKRLQEVGLVDAQRNGRSLRLHLTPEGQQAWSAMG